MEIRGGIFNDNKAGPKLLHSVKIVDMFEALHVITWVYMYTY
jgi:hypothetical protein